MRRKSSLDVVYELDEPKSKALTSKDLVSSKPTKTSERTAKLKKDIIAKVGLIVAVIYVCFLIIGAISTEYYSSADGKTKMVVADITVLENRKDYDLLESHIEQIREIMTDITIVDVKLSNETITYSQAAVLYTEILDDSVDVLIPKIKTLEVETRNEILRQNLQVILSNDIAFYLQFMIAGLTQQNETNVQNALVWKTSMLQTYKSIHNNMRELAITIHREDSDFFDWELERSVLEKDPTAKIKIEEEENSGN